MAMAATRGDISTLLNLMTSSTQLTASEYIRKTVGSIRFLYYVYNEKLGHPPMDLEDMVDGLLYVDSRNYIDKQAYEDAERKAELEAKNRK